MNEEHRTTRETVCPSVKGGPELISLILTVIIINIDHQPEIINVLFACHLTLNLLFYYLFFCSPLLNWVSFSILVFKDPILPL